MIANNIPTPTRPTLLIKPDPTIGFRLTASMKVNLPIEEVFEFFSDASQLERITPPWLRFCILTPLPIEMQSGTLLDYRLRLRGLPIRWQTEITEWEPCSRFVDEQIRGPYTRWHHEHTFESVAGGTLVYDNVHYIVPGGRLVNRLFVQGDVTKIFRYRQSALERILNGDATP